MSFRVSTENLTKASRDVDAVATTVDRLKPGAALAGVAGAMPGASSGSATKVLGSQLDRDASACGDQLESHADALRAAAKDFKRMDIFHAGGIDRILNPQNTPPASPPPGTRPPLTVPPPGGSSGPGLPGPTTTGPR